MNTTLSFTERVRLAAGLKEGEYGVYADSFSMTPPPMPGDRLTISIAPDGNRLDLVCVSRHYFMVRGKPPELNVLFDLLPHPDDSNNMGTAC